MLTPKHKSQIFGSPFKLKGESFGTFINLYIKVSQTNKLKIWHISLITAGLRNLGSTGSIAPKKLWAKSMFRRKSGASRRSIRKLRKVTGNLEPACVLAGNTYKVAECIAEKSRKFRASKAN